MGCGQLWNISWSFNSINFTWKFCVNEKTALFETKQKQFHVKTVFWKLWGNMAENTSVFTEDFTSDDHTYTITTENDVHILVPNYLKYKIGKLDLPWTDFKLSYRWQHVNSHTSFTISFLKTRRNWQGLLYWHQRLYYVKIKNSNNKMLAHWVLNPWTYDSKSNAVLSMLTGHVLLRRSLNFCWMHHYIRSLKPQSYKQMPS